MYLNTFGTAREERVAAARWPRDWSASNFGRVSPGSPVVQRARVVGYSVTPQSEALTSLGSCSDDSRGARAYPQVRIKHKLVSYSAGCGLRRWTLRCILPPVRAGVCFLGLIATAGLCAGCGNSRSGRGTVSGHGNGCGAPYTVRDNGRDVATPCAGTFSGLPQRLTMRRGERLVITRNLAERAGAGGFPALRPRGGSIRESARRGASTTFVAVRSGKSELVGRSKYCPPAQHRTCAAFIVLVR